MDYTSKNISFLHGIKISEISNTRNIDENDIIFFSKYENNVYKHTKTTTLSCIFEDIFGKFPRTYVIAFNTNGSSKSETTVIKPGTPITLPTLSDPYKIFLGWYDKNGDKIGDGGEVYYPSGDEEIIAYWKKITGTLKYYRSFTEEML